MYQQLFDHIKKTSPDFPEEAFKVVISKMRLVEMPKKTIFLKEASVCDRAAFVLQGCFRYYTTTRKGEDLVSQFAFEDWWIGDMQGLLEGTPSKVSIEALEDCSILTITATDYNQLLKDSLAFARFKQKARAKHYQAAVDRSMELRESAETRYSSLLAKFPGICQRIPQYHIASYLGVTPESLSRLRKQLAR